MHSLWEEDITYYARPHRGCTWKYSEAEKAVGDRLCSNRGVGCPFLSQEDGTCLNNFAGWHSGETS